MVHKTFIEDYKYLDKQIIKYFETNINNLTDNSHSFNQLIHWFLNEDDKIVIEYKNYFNGEINEVILSIDSLI